MERVFLAVGVVLLGCAVVAGVMYIQQGQWQVVLLLVAAGVLGKMVLGLAEIVLMPVSLPAFHFARRGNRLLSLLFAVPYAFLWKSVFAAYCIAVLLYCLSVPGPPAWLAVAMAAAISSAPFVWAAGRSTDDESPVHLDLVAAVLGVAISGGLLAYGVRGLPTLAPVAALFLLSAVRFIFWWSARGAQQARSDHA